MLRIACGVHGVFIAQGPTSRNTTTWLVIRFEKIVAFGGDYHGFPVSRFEVLLCWLLPSTRFGYGPYVVDRFIMLLTCPKCALSYATDEARLALWPHCVLRLV